MSEHNESYRLLVDLLHEAAQLEHSLLDAYLYTACSLKSMPQEFATIGGKENRRRAIQYERARAWKQSILMITHEEMLHLHYVQCLIRALGEAPFFTLPERDAQSGNWIIPNWQARIGDQPVNEGRGVEVPVTPLSPELINHFVLFEASDSLQDRDPFGDAAMALFESLYAFELDFRFESVLLHVEDDARREELKQKLLLLYTTLPPLPPEEAPEVALALREVELPPVEELKFQSIGDFYYQGILPLYEEAFDFGWVKETNRKLNNELLDPNYAAEGFLPVGPIKRDKNFDTTAQSNVEDPLSDFMRVEDIVKEIVEEGEGIANFEDQAEAFLAKVEELGGARAYLQALLEDRDSPDPTPPWLQEGEFLRQSHLYRFAMIMVELNREIELSRETGVDFEPARQPETHEGHAGLEKLAEELPAQFNACYLVLIAWLARMYEIREWMADKPRRLAIEMLASWPLMSMAIRPFLELASFFPIDLRQLFRLEADALPKLPIHAQQLYQLYASPERSEEINERMDYLAVRVLSDAAAWAAHQREVVARADALPDNARLMILARLQELARLDEFQKQFPFRVAGGYSNRMPDLTYQQTHADSAKYAENPGIDPNNPAPVYQDTLALRLRFAGYGLVQLATDPDPTFDEVGCTGTHMLNAADGDRRFDRALVWQNKPSNNVILRGPREQLPPLGVNCAEVALVVTDGAATAGYVPLQVMQSSGAVQSSGVQQELRVRGFLDVLALRPRDILDGDRQIRIDLLEKDGQAPYLNGLNHLVWQDGEPIDPFILAVHVDAPASGGGETQPALLFEREVFNQGVALLRMSPLQRLMSSRAPVGFDSYKNIPGWARRQLPDTLRKLLQDPGYPRSYLAQRARVLAGSLSEHLDGATGYTQKEADAVVSLAERLRLVSVPRGTTVAWLNFLLHYGHTISGPLAAGTGDNPIFAAVAERTGLHLSLTEQEDRDAPNARWLAKYTKGVMDTDAISDLVFGELYVPVTVEATDQPIALASDWTFPESMRSAVAAYACRFDHPFWAPFDVRNNERILELPDGTVITETLREQREDAYTYTMTGIEGMTDYVGTLALSGAEGSAGEVKLEWQVAFKGDAASAILNMMRVVGQAAEQMRAALTRHFTPGA